MGDDTSKLTGMHDVFLIGADLAHLDVIRRYKKEKLKIYNLTLIHPRPVTLIRDFILPIISKQISVDDVLIDLGHLCLDSGVSFIPENIIEIDIKTKMIITENQTLTFDFMSVANKPYSDGLDILETITGVREKCPHNLLFKGESFFSAEIILALRQQIDHSTCIKFVSSTSMWPKEVVEKMKLQLAKKNINLIQNDSHPYSSAYYLDKPEPQWYQTFDRQMKSWFKFSIAKADLTKADLAKADLAKADHFIHSSAYVSLRDWEARHSFLWFCLSISGRNRNLLWKYLQESFGCRKTRLHLSFLQSIADRLFVKLDFNPHRKWPPNHQRGFFYRKRLKKLARQFQIKAGKIRTQTYLESGIFSGDKKKELTLSNLQFSNTEISLENKPDIKSFQINRKRKKTPPYRAITEIDAEVQCNEKDHIGELECFECNSNQSKAIKKTTSQSEEKKTSIKNRLSSLKCLDLSNGQILLERMESLNFNNLSPFWGGALIAKKSCSGFELCGLFPQSYLITLELPSEMESMILRKHDLFCQGILWFFRDYKLTALQCQLKNGLNSNAQMTLQGIFDQTNILKSIGYKSSHDTFDIILTKPLGSSLLFEGYNQFLLTTPDFWNGLSTMLHRDLKAGEVLNQFKIERACLISSEGTAKTLHKLLLPEETANIKLDRLASFPGVTDLLKKNFRTQTGEANKNNFKAQILSLPSRKAILAELLFSDETAGAWLVIAPKNQSKQLLSALKASGLVHSCFIGETSPKTSTSYRLNFD